MSTPDREERYQRLADRLPRHLDDGCTCKTGENYDLVLDEHEAGRSVYEIASPRGWVPEAVEAVVRVLGPVTA